MYKQTRVDESKNKHGERGKSPAFLVCGLAANDYPAVSPNALKMMLIALTDILSKAGFNCTQAKIGPAFGVFSEDEMLETSTILTNPEAWSKDAELHHAPSENIIDNEDEN